MWSFAKLGTSIAIKQGKEPISTRISVVERLFTFSDSFRE